MIVQLITKEELEKLINSTEDYRLIDVREPEEIESYGAIPTSKNIPLGEIVNAFNLPIGEFEIKYSFSFNKDTKLIFYCRSGGRSAQASELVSKKGCNTFNFKGSILEWSKTHPEIKAY